MQLSDEPVRICDLGTVLLQAGGNAHQAVDLGRAGLTVEEDHHVSRQGEFTPPAPIGLVARMSAGDQAEPVDDFAP
jgi:hypothetical protein